MNPNDLLLWLSAKGSGSWGRFRSAVDELQLPEASEDGEEDLDEGIPESGGPPATARLRWNLERLGHVEFFLPEFKNGWRIVPPTLACDDTGLLAILCGARTDTLLRQLDDATRGLNVQRTPQNECPDMIKIAVEEQGQLRSVAETVGLHLQQRAASQLLAAIPPIDDPQLRRSAELPFGSWDVGKFVPETLRWASITAEEAREAASGLFKFNDHSRMQYYLRQRGQSFRVEVRAGKYTMLRKSRLRVTNYDSEKMEFSLPVACRPPLLIDRSLTLCSGLIPAVTGGNLLYRDVGNDKAISTRALLRQ